MITSGEQGQVRNGKIKRFYEKPLGPQFDQIEKNKKQHTTFREY